MDEPVPKLPAYAHAGGCGAYGESPAPDRLSETLRRYHQTLWSKDLPDGSLFHLTDEYPKGYLLHKSQLSEIALSRDSIGHTYRYVESGHRR